jgi:NTE family protein
LLAAGCAHYSVNQPLHPGSESRPAGPVAASTGRSEELLLVLAFSGGGKRASALALGVLEGLADVDAGPGRRRLLDEVDVISAVSGGSFTAAYFGLYRDRVFSDYQPQFLARSQRLDALLRLLNPWNLIRLASPWYGRSDLTADYYNRVLFHGATYASLWQTGGPQILIQATDITEGTRFTFDRDQFDLICSDLASYPVARAVAASAAFPVVFSPLTLRNWADGCALPEPPWIGETLARRDIASREFHMALQARAYRDPTAKRYVHLLDGGIADNLGLRGPLSDLLLREGPETALLQGDLRKPLRVAFIIVNAQNRVRREFGLLAETPGTGQIVDAVASLMINRYNFETVDHLRRSLELWSRDAARIRGSEVDAYIIEVSFDGLRDEQERLYLAALPTTMALPANVLNHLRSAGRRLLMDAPEFRRLVDDLGGTVRGDAGRPDVFFSVPSADPTQRRWGSDVRHRGGTPRRR